MSRAMSMQELGDLLHRGIRRSHKPHIQIQRTTKGNPYWACEMDEGLDSVRGTGDSVDEAFRSWRFVRSVNRTFQRRAPE